MNPATAYSEPKPTPASVESSRIGSRLLVLLFVAFCVAAAVNQHAHFWPEPSWFYAALVVTALLAAVASFAPVLPWPNVLLAAGLAAFIGGMAEAISGATGFPFGRDEFTPVAGPLFLGLFPWWLPVMWSVIALAARGTARLVLHRSRQHPHHGYRVIGLATVLALVTTVTLERFAIHAAHFWTAGTSTILNYTACLALHLFIQVAQTPLLLDKFPGPRPPNVLPLLVWGGINLVLVAGRI